MHYDRLENWDVLDEPLTTLLSTLNTTVSIFKKALFFLILRVSLCPYILPLVDMNLPSLKQGNVLSSSRAGSTGSEELSSSS